MTPPFYKERCDEMAEEQRDVILPIEQATISFYGYPVIAVKLPDGKIGAVLRNMCEALQIDRKSQVRRIREDELIADCLVLVQVETDGGPQATDVLIAWAIPYWLLGVQLNRVAPEKHEAILFFKRRGADILYQHFSQTPVSPQSIAVVPTEVTSPVKPVEPTPDASDEEWASYYEQMARLRRWKHGVDMRLFQVDIRLEEVEQRQDAMESHMENVEEVTRLIPEIIQQLGPQTLSPEHQRSVQASAKRLHELTGVPYPTIYDELRQYFHVGTYTQIPEAQWSEVIAWFQKRIEKAKMQKKN